jgi:hypothetical protein
MVYFIYQVNQSLDDAALVAIRSLGVAYLFFYGIRNPYTQIYLKKRFAKIYEKADKVFTKFNET